MKKNNQKIASTLALLGVAGDAYLAREVKEIHRHFGSRSGKAVLLRGIVDGLQQACFVFADCATEYHIAAKIKAALAAVPLVAGEVK
jgi:hypothetical protein